MAAESLKRMAGLAQRAMIALALLAGMTACTATEVPTSGVVEAASDPQAEGKTVRVTVPSGVIEFTVGAPVSKLTADDTANGESYAAPAEHSLVPVAWAQVDMAPNFGLAISARAPSSTADLSLTAGDATVKFAEFNPATGRGSGISWVSLPVDEEISVQVAYDGETQSVEIDSGARDPGAAAGFYLDDSLGSLRCPELASDSGARLQWTAICEINGIDRTPYLAGVGWAGDGKVWLVADTSVIPQSITLGDSEYQVGPRATLKPAPPPRTTLDGAEPDVVLAERTAESASSSVAFRTDVDAPEAALKVRRSYYIGRRTGTSGPAARVLTIEFEVAIPAADTTN